MKKLVIKLFIFILPFILVLSVPLATLYNYKENFVNIDPILKENEKYLIGYAYNEKNYKYLKYKVLNERPRMKVWALGSSRILQFREEMFSESFYNAGYTITNIKDYKEFFKTVPSQKYPEVLLINLDQWMFNQNFDQLKATSNKTQWTDAFTEYPKYTTIVDVWKDVFNKKYSVFNAKTNDLQFGLNAYVNNKGFRNDGSMFYGKQIKKLNNKNTSADDYKFEDTFKRIVNGANRFEYGSKFNNESLQILEEFLIFCKKNKITVIAFLPPFAPDVLDKMENSGNYKYIDQIHTSIQPLFNKYNAELYDFTNPKTINAANDEFLDGFHGGEKSYGKILIEIVNHNTVIRKYINSVAIQRELQKTGNNFQLFPYL